LLCRLGTIDINDLPSYDGNGQQRVNPSWADEKSPK
jgi:hypothetical protein